MVKVDFMELKSNQLGVENFFNAPTDNQCALRCYGDIDNMDYSGFDSNLYKYLNEKSILEMIKVNSEITRILDKFKIVIKINMKILHHLIRNHLPQTRDIALGIAKYLPKELKSEVNPKALAEATGLHDIAKVIIPENIINKPSSLNEYEREIMQEHAKLSYEMLKTTDLDKETLKLIKHHHYADERGMYNINLQILSIADIYSALREKRAYKNEMSKEDALAIINKETLLGKFHPSVYKALADYADKDEGSAPINPKR
jgi:putative nucleotidyltransferase with HDIG domain